MAYCKLLFNYIKTLFHLPANAKYQRSEVKKTFITMTLDTNQKAVTCVV